MFAVSSGKSTEEEPKEKETEPGRKACLDDMYEHISQACQNKNMKKHSSVAEDEAKEKAIAKEYVPQEKEKDETRIPLVRMARLWSVS